MLSLQRLLEESGRLERMFRFKEDDRIVRLFGMYACLVLMLCFFMADTANLMWVCVIALMGLMLLHVASQKGLPYKNAATLLTALAYAFVLVTSVEQGGIFASTATWILFLPALSIMQGRQAALRWMVVSLVMIAGLAALTYSRHQGQNMAATSNVWWSMVVHMASVIGYFFCIGLHEIFQNEAHSKLAVQNKALEEAHEQLEAAQTYQDNVVASVSHELRTPMNAILGFNDLLQGEIKHPKALQISEYIGTSAKQLLRVINGILDYSQLLAGKLQMQCRPMDLCQMLRDLERTYALQASQKQLKFKFEVPPRPTAWVNADVERLTQVMEHLLNNAFKFTSKGHVSMRVKWVEKRVRIEVQDSGIGIAQAEQPQVFGRFQQGSQEINRRYGGTGLGLAICEQIVQLHHGRMGVLSTEGEGATFWVELDQCNEKALDADQVTLKTPDSTAPLSSPKTHGMTSFVRKLKSFYVRACQGIIDRYSESMEKDRVSVFMIFGTGLVLFSPIYALSYPEAPTFWIGLLMSPIILAAMWGLYTGLWSLRTAVNGVSAYCVIHLGLMALYSGGIRSAVMPWFALIPIASLYLLEIRSAVIWLAVCLLVDVFMACVTSAGWLLESPAITGPSWIWHTVNFLHLSVLMPYLPLHYKFLQSRTMQKIRDQNASMSEAKNALLREKARMEEFIASVSHEFRTPMNAIMGFTELLEEHIQGSPSALEMHGHMTQSAKHLLTVIDDILDYSQLQKGQLTIRRETFELGKVCESAHTMFKPRVQARHIDYRLQMDARPMWVEGDSHRLMQLLVNLLGNAVKFTDKGLITLTVSNQDGGVLFEVRDTGIGIAPERVGQLFQHFEQVHALLPGRYEGNGLGLAISKRLIELQGGRISVSSALGVGSVFSMWLPLTAVAAPAHELQTGKSTTTSTEELKVLVVDDHPLNRLLVSQIIQKNWPQAQLVEAEDGGHAVEIMQDQTFHVVLMDMVMPVMDGIEATRHIRQNMSAPACDTPILGLTANVNPIDKQRCIEAGMKEVLYKPLNKEVLIHHIEAILRRI